MVVAPKTSLWRMADRMADGRLAAILFAFRAEDLSWEAISARLYADHGIEVTPQTLRVWATELGSTDVIEAVG